MEGFEGVTKVDVESWGCDGFEVGILGEEVE